MSPAALEQRLTIKHLRLIAAIAEHRQLSLAAQTLRLTQPAASRSLGEIEQLCGVAIFERHARGMTLTPVGELLARRARNVLEEIGEASAEVARYREGRGGTVRIGAVTGGAIGHVVPVLQVLRQVAPEVEVHVEVGMSRELVRELVALRLDFALARLPPEANADEFEVVRAAGEIVDIIVAARHPAAGGGEVGLADLLGHDWVMQARGAPIRAAVEAALLAAGARPPERVTNTSSLLVTIAMLAASDAVAPVSREVAELIAGARPAAGIVALPLRERIVVAPYALLSLKGRHLSPAAQRCQRLIAGSLRGEAPAPIEGGRRRQSR
jgi:DNA-binding transcriptional LysR family regulator